MNLYRQVKVLPRSRAQPRIIQRSVDILRSKRNNNFSDLTNAKTKYLKKSKVLELTKTNNSALHEGFLNLAISIRAKHKPRRSGC